MVILQIEQQELSGMIEAAVQKAVTASMENLQQKGSSEKDKILTVEEAADFLKCKVATIYDNVGKGSIPYMKRSKRLYFSENELRDYLKIGSRRTNRQIMEESRSYIQAK